MEKPVAPPHPPKVLVVDDEKQNRDLLAELLRNDCRVILAKNGIQAIERAHELQPDLILLDVMMPNMTGHDACLALKADAATRDIPVIFVTAMADTEDEAWHLFRSRERARVDRNLGRFGPLLPPEDIFLKVEDFFALANAHAQLVVRGNEPTEPGQAPSQAGAWARPLPDLSVERGGQDPLRKLEQHIDKTDKAGQRVLVVAESAGRRESLMELLRDHRINLPSIDTLQAFVDSDHRHAITAAPLAAGFIWSDTTKPALGIQFITETELFDATPTTRRRRKSEQVTDLDSLIKDLSELNVGDPVVHSNHGIGRYQGMSTLTVAGVAGDVVTVRGREVFVNGEPVGLAGRFEQRHQAVEIVQVADDAGVAFGKIVERSRLKIDVRRSHRVLLYFGEGLSDLALLSRLQPMRSGSAVV